MDNKYGLGGAKMATGHHETHHKTARNLAEKCKSCGGGHLVLSPTMRDHRCTDCDEWQNDIPQGYSTGRSNNY